MFPHPKVLNDSCALPAFLTRRHLKGTNPILSDFFTLSQKGFGYNGLEVSFSENECTLIQIFDAFLL